MQQEIERIYNTFIGRVAEGRKLSVATVDEMGQGRVWSGTDAKRLKLIDDFGGLNKAVEEAAKLAKISKYSIKTLPKIKDPFVKLMEQISGDYQDTRLQAELGTYFTYFTFLRKMATADKFQARMPYEISVY